MRTLVVGDIHGCFVEFQQLLEAAQICAHDRVVSVGDTVDRGRDGELVLKYFMENPNALAVMGNHERKHLQIARGKVRPALSQQLQLRDFSVGFWDDALSFMSTLPFYLELEDALVAHAFFEPGKSPSLQEENVLVGTMTGQKMLEKNYPKPWYELYDYGKPIVVGHLHYGTGGRPFIVPDRVYALDTGCCRGLRLTGLLLPEFRIVSVPAQMDHWEATRRRHYSPEEQLAVDLELPWAQVEAIIDNEQYRWLAPV